MSDLADAKRDLRRQLRAMRRALPDTAERSARIWDAVRALEAVDRAATVMAFTSVPGEPDTAPFLGWCRATGRTVLLPEDDPPPDASAIDVVIVPGVAFTADGHRLGQGGGWYDRFLTGVRADTPTIGVAFAPQLVEWLPVEDHDVRLDVVVTDEGVHHTARPA